MSKDNILYFCTICGKTHGKTAFYVSNNPLHKNGRLPFCKNAVKDYVSAGSDAVDVAKLQNILRQVDLPYIHSLYQSAIEDERETVGVYFSQINSLKQYQNLTWEDSEFGEEVSTGELLTARKDFVVTAEIKNRWGGGFEIAEYQFLEDYFHEYTSRLEKETPAEISLVGHICRAELNAFKLSKEGTAKEYGDAVKVVTDLMGKLNLSPNQQKDLSASENAFGVFIKQIENEEPIDEWDSESDFAKDVMGTFKFMIGHIAKMLGKQNPFEEEYNSIINEYSADMENLEDE